MNPFSSPTKARTPTSPSSTKTSSPSNIHCKSRVRLAAPHVGFAVRTSAALEKLMPEIQYRKALRQAQTEEMDRDPNVFLLGEEVAEYNGAYKVSEGMLARFGPERVIDTPISEAGFSGLGLGAAMCGLRPIVEFMSWSFSLVCMDQLMNNAA